MTASGSPSPRPSGLATVLNAIANAGRVPAREADVRSMLATGRGDPSQLRALFGDVALATLLRLAIGYGIDDATLSAAYATAKAEAAAANPELDAFVA